MRAMRQVALKGVYVLKREKQFLKNDQQFSQIAVKYFDIARRFNTNEDDFNEMVQLYQQVLQI